MKKILGTGLIVAVLIACLSLTAQAAATLTASITVSPTTYEENSWVYINVTVKNSGTSTAQGIMVQRAMAIQDRQNVGDVGPGSEVMVQFTYQVTKSEKVTFNVVDADGKILAAANADVAPSAVQATTTKPPETTTKQPTTTSDDWWTAWEQPTTKVPNNNTQPTVNAPNNNTQPTTINNGEWWDMWDTTAPVNNSNNSADDAAIMYTPDGSLQVLDDNWLILVSEYPIIGGEFVKREQPELLDFPEQTILLFPAQPGRGELISLHTNYVNGINSIDLSDTSEWAKWAQMVNGGNGGNNNLQATFFNLNANGTTTLNGGLGFSGNETLAVKSPQTGQRTDMTAWIISIAVFLIVGLIGLYIKVLKPKA